MPTSSAPLKLLTNQHGDDGPARRRLSRMNLLDPRMNLLDSRMNLLDLVAGDIAKRSELHCGEAAGKALERYSVANILRAHTWD